MATISNGFAATTAATVSYGRIAIRGDRAAPPLAHRSGRKVIILDQDWSFVVDARPIRRA